MLGSIGLLLATGCMLRGPYDVVGDPTNPGDCPTDAIQQHGVCFCIANDRPVASDGSCNSVQVGGDSAATSTTGSSTGTGETTTICPANAHVVSAGICACNTGYVESGTSCVPAPTCPANATLNAQQQCTCNGNLWPSLDGSACVTPDVSNGNYTFTASFLVDQDGSPSTLNDRYTINVESTFVVSYGGPTDSHGWEQLLVFGQGQTQSVSGGNWLMPQPQYPGCVNTLPFGGALVYNRENQTFVQYENSVLYLACVASGDVQQNNALELDVSGAIGVTVSPRTQITINPEPYQWELGATFLPSYHLVNFTATFQPGG